jgi:hypothetical protein
MWTSACNGFARNSLGRGATPTSLPESSQSMPALPRKHKRRNAPVVPLQPAQLRRHSTIWHVAAFRRKKHRHQSQARFARPEYYADPRVPRVLTNHYNK